MQTTLITGATGYLGSHLAAAFVLAGHRVAIFKRSKSNLARIEKLLPDLKVFNIDDGLLLPFQALGHIDTVIHTATCYGRNGEEASEIFEANTAFPLRLLEQSCTNSVDTFINTDTFFNSGNFHYKYLNSYSLSKHQFAQWGKSFSSAEKIRFINLKLEHMYGAGDDAAKFVTNLIRACLLNTGEIELTLGEQRRDFVHINDVVAAYLRISGRAGDFRLGFSEFDVGTGQSTSIYDFAATVQRVSGSRTKLLFGALPYRENEIMFSEADASPLKALGWAHQYDLEAGIRQVVEAERIKC